MADLTGLSARAPPGVRSEVLVERLRALCEQIGGAERQSGRPPGSVTLLAISKGFPGADVRALARAGQAGFGESYLSEALPKLDACADMALEWHYVGRLQTRKLANIAQRFGWVHSLETGAQARDLGRARPPGAGALQVCIQVNVDAEAGKAGVSPSGVPQLADAVAGTTGLALRGLMALPTPPARRANPRAPFRRLAELFHTLRAAGHPLDTLSMGMSADFEDAIAEGATLVRIGTALFGPRE